MKNYESSSNISLFYLLHSKYNSVTSNFLATKKQKSKFLIVPCEFVLKSKCIIAHLYLMSNYLFVILHNILHNISIIFNGPWSITFLP